MEKRLTDVDKNEKIRDHLIYIYNNYRIFIIIFLFILCLGQLYSIRIKLNVSENNIFFNFSRLGYEQYIDNEIGLKYSSSESSLKPLLDFIIYYNEQNKIISIISFIVMFLAFLIEIFSYINDGRSMKLLFLILGILIIAFIIHLFVFPSKNYYIGISDIILEKQNTTNECYYNNICYINFYRNNIIIRDYCKKNLWKIGEFDINNKVKIFDEYSYNETDKCDYCINCLSLSISNPNSTCLKNKCLRFEKKTYIIRYDCNDSIPIGFIDLYENRVIYEKYILKGSDKCDGYIKSDFILL